jgi:H+/Cl- antiporter ClcA
MSPLMTAPLTAASAPPSASIGAKLSDFTVDRRILLLIAMALVVGSAGALCAWALVKLIALVTNLVWFGRISVASVSLARAARGPWMVLAPALGGLAIGLMARFGSQNVEGSV